MRYEFMKSKTKMTTGLFAFGLLATLIVKVLIAPEGILLPVLWTILSIVVGCFLLTYSFELFIKTNMFPTTYFLVSSAFFLYLHFSIEPVKLKIVIPESYSGPVSLVLSNVEENILTTDSSGIGYINEKTFKRLYVQPMVVDHKGMNISDFSVASGVESFWGLTSRCCIDGKEVQAKTFKLIRKKMNKRSADVDLLDLVDKRLVKGE
ncbi:hypothetical protein WSM22_19050 [Cytophagales bacterium WSM2-2]|nr:hypothetical protein WSM22_19050 [Cytophagales bacterium WSM2-2]